MKKKRIAMLLAAALTFSQSMGAAIPVAAEELTADTGQETAETEESVQENDDSETIGKAASVPDLEDDEELSLQDDAENAEEEIAEEDTSETTELFGDNTENQEAFSDGSEAGESAVANEQYQLNLIFEGASGGQDLLPNSRVRIKSRLVDTIGYSDVSAYELKVAPVTGGNGVKMADVFEAAKGLAERVRQISGLTTDGGMLFQTAFSKNDPYIFFNAMKTESERSEFTGLKELLDAIFHLVRNPAAHTPKINWKTDEIKALDILTLISFAHKYLDECHRIPGK